METKTIEKYYNALKELKLILEYSPKLPLLPFIKKKGLSKNAANEIVKGGLVKNIGSRGRGANYVWNTIEPNYKMAEELIKRVNNVSVESMRKSRNKPKQKIVDNITLKLFFGLIILRFNINYKN